MRKPILLFAIALMSVAAPILAAVETRAGSSGSFCISGVVTKITLQRDPQSATACGLYTSNVVAVTVDLNGGARINTFKSFSPNAVLCASRTLKPGDAVTYCGKLAGYILNAGTINEAWGWNVYPASLTKP